MGQEDIIKELRDGISYARKNKTVKVFHKMFNNVPSWEEFIEHLNYEYWNDTIPAQKPNPGEPETHHNGVCIRQNFYFNVRRPGFDNEILRESFNINDLMLSALGVIEGRPLVSFINFVRQPEENLNIHYDKRDMCYWQCQGSVEWRIYGKFDESMKDDFSNFPYDRYILNPGDFIFVPDSTIHAIQANSPRAGISFGYNDREWL